MIEIMVKPNLSLTIHPQKKNIIRMPTIHRATLHKGYRHIIRAPIEKQTRQRKNENPARAHGMLVPRGGKSCVCLENSLNHIRQRAVKVLSTLQVKLLDE